MSFYVEFARGGLNRRGHVVSKDEAVIKPGERECYRSLFYYGPYMLEYAKQHGGVAEIHAPHCCEAFPIDVDNVDLETARLEAIQILERLETVYDVPKSFVRIYFSGAKGFHLMIPFQAIADAYLRPHFAGIFYAMAEKMFRAPKVDMSIYEPVRIFRIVNSVNAKTGLHKIQISYDELCGAIEEIKELAKTPRIKPNTDCIPIDKITRCAGIARVFEECETNRKVEAPKKSDTVFDLLEGITTGGRNEALVRLTGLLLSKGFDQQYALEILRGWNHGNKPPLEEAELAETVAKQYRMYGKNIMPDAAPEIITMRQAGENYLTYMKRMETARVATGFPAIDKKLRAIAPGEVVCIVGRTSVGKSALLQNIAMNYAQNSGAPVLFFSLEMPDTSVYERSLQLEYSKRGFEVEAMFRDEKTARAKIDEIAVAMSNFYIVVKPMTMERIVSYIRYAEAEIFDGKTGLVCIDYLGLVKGKGNNIYEEISRIAREMKEAAKELDIPICYLSQVNKNYKIDQELELGAARDSGAIDEAADYILGIWRAEQQLQLVEKKMRCNIGILKNRKGGLVQLTAWMSKETLRFEVEDEEHEIRSQTIPF